MALASPTAAGEWVSMAVTSDGSYDIPEGLIYSFPCTVNEAGDYEIVQGINLDERAYERAMNSARELMSERDAVKELLK